MNITQNLKGYNKRYSKSKNSTYFLKDSGLPPYRFRHKLCVENTVLKELILLSYSLPSNGNDFKLKNCFAYFGRKFGINKLQMQKASYHLSSWGVISRSFREVITGEDAVFKELDLTLHIDRLNAALEEEVD